MKKNLGVVYQEIERREMEERGRGSRVAGSERGTEGRAPTGGGARRRRRELPQREEEEVEEQEGEWEDDLPPADGSEGEEEEGAEQEGESAVYLRGPVQLPQPVAAALRPLLRPDGAG
jgi:predicted transposase YdaD